jgi:hypothetical protein
MATGRIGTTPVLQVRWSKAPSDGTTSLSGLDDNSVSLVYSVGYEAVYRNGVLLSRGNDYTATDGTTVTLIDATITGDIIEIFANQTIPLSDTYSQTVADGKFINNTLTTTTGDIIYASGANTPARLAIGTSADVLTVSGGIPAWAAPAGAGKGYTLINAGGTALTGAQTITVSGLGSYESYIIYCNASSANTGSNITFRLNADSGSNYTSRGVAISNAATYTSAFLNNVEQDGGTEYEIGTTATNLHTGYLTIGIRIEGGNSTDAKAIQVSAGFWEGSTRTGQRTTVSTGLYLGTSAITSFSLLSSSGNFDQGTLFIYGSSN